MEKVSSYNKFYTSIIILFATVVETYILLDVSNSNKISYFVFSLALAIVSGGLAMAIMYAFKLKVNPWFDHRERLFDAVLFFSCMSFLNDSFLFPNYLEALAYVVGIEIVLHLIFWMSGKK